MKLLASRRTALKIAMASGAGAALGIGRASAQSNAKPMILDAQVHCYERNHPGRPWASSSLEGPPEVTGDDMIAAMDAAGVDGAVLISTWSMYRYDPSYAVSVHAKYPGRFGLVNPVDSNDPAVAEKVSDWAATKGAIGIRALLMPNVTPENPNDPGLNSVLVSAAQHSLPVNVQCMGRLEQCGQLAKRNPDTIMLVDHLGLRPQPDPWADLPQLLALAAYPNVMVKLTGICALSQEDFPYNDIWSPLSRIFDAFGMDRCLWGTDWTVRVKKVSYKQSVDAFFVTKRLSNSDRAAVMSGNLRRIYRWSPAKT